jgi:integrase
MPKYTQSNIEYIIRPDVFKVLFHAAPTREQKIWLLLLWLTGGRPEEIIRLEKKDLQIENDKITISLITLKYPKTSKFVYRRRNLCIHISPLTPYLEYLKHYLNTIKRDKLFPFTKRTGYNYIARIGIQKLGFPLCPYNFRHSRMTLLAEAGATNDELKRFKGSTTDQSIKNYVHARKVEYTVETTIK